MAARLYSRPAICRVKNGLAEGVDRFLAQLGRVASANVRRRGLRLFPDRERGIGKIVGIFEAFASEPV